MRNRDAAGNSCVLKLLVAADVVHLIPAVCFKNPDDLPAVHLLGVYTLAIVYTPWAHQTTTKIHTKCVIHRRAGLALHVDYLRLLFPYTVHMSRLRPPEPSGLHDLLLPVRLAGSIPRSRPKDTAAAEADLHRPGEDSRAGAPREAWGDSESRAGARARNRERPGRVLLAAYTGAVSRA
jgi:hypothetical protein